MNGLPQAGSVGVVERALPQAPTAVQHEAVVEDWGAQIRECFAKGGIHTLELARMISTAKQALQRGQWTQLCRTGELPFSKRKAEMLVTVGNALGDLNAQTFAQIPAGWSILYRLAQLPRPMLEAFIADGSIHPALTLAEAEALLARFRGDASAKSLHSKVAARLRRFQQFVRSTCTGWTVGERQLARAALQELLVTLSEPVSLSCVSHPTTPRRTAQYKVNS